MHKVPSHYFICIHSMTKTYLETKDTPKTVNVFVLYNNQVPFVLKTGVLKQNISP